MAFEPYPHPKDGFSVLSANISLPIFNSVYVALRRLCDTSGAAPLEKARPVLSAR